MFSSYQNNFPCFVDNVPNNAVDIESLAIEVKKSLISSINLGYKKNNSNNNGDTIVKLLSFCMVGSQLTSISLSYCSIDCYRMQNLVIALKSSSITSVKLVATSMTSEVMKIFVSCLINSKITNLQLSNLAKLDVGALKCLSLALRNTQISSLNLRYNKLDCQSLKVLAPCLEDSKLTYLDLAYNGIDYENEIRKIERSDVGVKCLAMALKKSEITSLNLASNGLSCKSLMSIILSLPYTKVTTLNLNGNDICCNVFYLADIIKSTQINYLDVGMMNARKALSMLYDSHSKTKTHLNLSYLMRCSFSLYYLSHVELLHTKNITHLELKQNQISCCGELKDICECISGSQIVSLDLSENKINSVYHLAELLQHSSISTLNLSYNQISSDGIKHLSLRLPGSKVISLDLSYNLITDESIEYLSDSLVNTKITDLNLSGNQIGRQAVENLSERVAHIIVQFQLQSDDPQNHFYLCKYPDCIIEVYRTSSEVNIHHLIDYVGNKIEMTKVFIRSKKVNDHVDSNLANMTHFSNINISEIEMVQHSSFPYFIFKNISQLKLNGTRTENAPGGNGEKIIELRLQNIQNLKLKDLQELRFSNIMYLDLSNNNMEDDQLECLVAALKSNSMNQSNKNYLMSLNLSNNKLEARSAELLAEVLQYLPTLTYIDLHGNEIGYAGFQSLMKVVDKTNLCWLSLGDNNIEDHLEGNIELSPYIVPRKGDEMPVAFQLRYLFRQLVSLNTCSGELEFTIPTTDSNPPVNITHYPKLLKIYSEFENDVDYLNVDVYDIYYMKSKKHDMCLLQRIEKFVHEIEKRFLSFIDNNLPKLEQAFGYDSFVALVKECDRLGLTKCVESLLLHRVCYYVDDAGEILHPFIYRMLHKYSMPLYCKQIEPNKREQIIAYYQTHSEIEGAHTLIDLLTSMFMSNEES
ncbi:uncharacterized protein LOC120350030 isoform X1 [Nilaparvata lugens]|uniref:uncharacterized protein LOC120350030 isoform X1 n=1 Tax=Nilaparvata lugens TaxID=108931 RepID=UPI00193CDCF4|nr:uncharacterized protein LOC120350030 isoform X1 [Nilaparvata lugens]